MLVRSMPTGYVEMKVSQAFNKSKSLLRPWLNSEALDTHTITLYINEVFSHLETLGLGELASWVKQIHMMPFAA